MRIGYIQRIGNQSPDKFRFIEAAFTRRISERSDRCYSKTFGPLDFEEVRDNARLMRKSPHVVLVEEPFLLDEELRGKAVRWVDWANNVEPSEYDPFAQAVVK